MILEKYQKELQKKNYNINLKTKIRSKELSILNILTPGNRFCRKKFC